jgi:hypothetical protein
LAVAFAVVAYLILAVPPGVERGFATKKITMRQKGAAICKKATGKVEEMINDTMIAVSAVYWTLYLEP